MLSSSHMAESVRYTETEFTDKIPHSDSLFISYEKILQVTMYEGVEHIQDKRAILSY